ncbi:hypothetical protein CL614_10670 [archaeon]|nr:hypothetical protein [archaeon]|tara:strand:- start:1716 stop:2738 length:1023 start_codon:yes stop_codon:yes gene_type:complete
MKSFKQHLTEIYGLKSVKELVFSNLNVRPSLPISKLMFMRLTSEKKRIRSIHVTGFEGFVDLLSLLGTRKQVATMTNLGAMDTIKHGVTEPAGIAVVLEGYPVLESSYDLHTRVDDQGRRWIDIDQITEVTKDREIEDTLVGAMHVVRSKIIKEIRQKFKFEAREWENLNMELPDRKAEKEEDDELRKFGVLRRTASRRQIQGYAIKRYMDLIESMVWKPNITRVMELLSGATSYEWSWNEIDLVDTEIVEVHLLKFDVRQWVINSGGDPDDPEDDMLAFMDEDDLEYYNGHYIWYMKNGYNKKYKTIVVNNADNAMLDANAQKHFRDLFAEVQRYNKAR